MSDAAKDLVQGDGYAVGHLDVIGEGYGFRKIRSALGVTAFGVNAIVIPPGYEAGMHSHERQEETYFLHQGRVEMQFGDGSRHVLEPGSVARVDAPTVRGVKNVGDEDAIVLVVGGKDGYVGRDGVFHGERGDAAREAGRPPGA
jgi:quercetin dioxygenase-like cupin family protein